MRARVTIVVNGERFDRDLFAALKRQRGVRVLYQTKPSIFLARRYAREEVRAPFFGFLDDDDQLLPGALATRVRALVTDLKADVVVTNPTHYAVALKYDGEKAAPIVVAQGKDLIAFKIRDLARQNGVPVVPDPPLARSLHASVEVGHMIPEELYQAVAQLLAFVYRTAGRRRQLAASSASTTPIAA